MKREPFDKIDIKILDTYRLKGPIADKQMAHEIGRSIRPTQERIARLKAVGAIQEAVEINLDKICCPLCGKMK